MSLLAKTLARIKRWSMDRKLVAVMEPYEVAYLAQKHKITRKEVREIVKAVGRSRRKVEMEIRARKAH